MQVEEAWKGHLLTEKCQITDNRETQYSLGNFFCLEEVTNCDQALGIILIKRTAQKTRKRRKGKSKTIVRFPIQQDLAI